MKKIIATLVVGFIATVFSFGQEAKTVKLKQTTGKFDKTELKLKAGTPYVFEVVNADVDHEVGFVIAPKGSTEMSEHIPAAYLQKTIKKGEKSSSKTVVLEKGEYEYFCPMNPTPHYVLVVE